MLIYFTFLQRINVVPIAITEYLGCYIDDYDRALPNYIISRGDDMTRSICWEHCASHNQRYGALQNGAECYCGNSNHNYSKHGKVDDSECNTPCSGNSSEVCGGAWRSNVFDLGEVYYIINL